MIEICTVHIYIYILCIIVGISMWNHDNPPYVKGRFIGPKLINQKRAFNIAHLFPTALDRQIGGDMYEEPIEIERVWS